MRWEELTDHETIDLSQFSIDGLEAALMTMRRHCERIHGAGTQPARPDR
jgi:hypothetical protein